MARELFFIEQENTQLFKAPKTKTIIDNKEEKKVQTTYMQYYCFLLLTVITHGE